MDRRSYLKRAGAASGLLLAGCLGGGSNSGSGNGGGSSSSSSSSSSTSSTSSSSTSGNESASSTSSSGGNASLPKKIVIGSDIPYKPFEYKKNNGKTVGFDVDIANAVFKEQLGIDYKFQPTSFDGIIAALNNDNFRVIMSAMTINDKRAKKVDFSDPYFTAYQTIVVPKDSDISSKSDMKGKQVGVQKGTTGAEAADKLKKEFSGNLTIKRYDQIPDAFNALMNNQVDAVINDNTVNAAFVDEHGDKVRFVKGKGEAAKEGEKAPPYLTLTVEHYGIAFRKDDDEFRKKVNGALDKVKNSDEYQKIYNQYFSG